jgi:hypothetical protein
MSFNPKITGGVRRYPLAADPAQAFAASALIAATAGTLHGLWVYSGNAIAGMWIQIHDSANAVSGGGTINCLIEQKAGVQGSVYFKFGPGGMRFYNGLFVCTSTTAYVHSTGAAECQFLAAYSLKPT